jgi:ADP-heptose:LPS heptosyltransferase
LHAVDRNLALLTPLGIESPAVRFQVPQHAADRAAAEAILRQTGLSEPFAIVNVGAGWPSKLWPADRYAAVAAYLGRARGLPSLVVWGNAEERARAEQVMAAAQGHGQLAPKMTLSQLAVLAGRAKLFLGSDTGPLHLAAAVGTPCVGLYGPWPAEKHGPYGTQHVVLQKMRFEGSTRQRRHAPPIYMEAIDVAAVCAACDQILTRAEVVQNS